MPSLEEIMKMAQNVQAEMQKAQESLDKIEVEGAAGGGLVKVRATDGVHFEREGGDMIAREVLKALNRAYDLTSWRKTGTA